MARYARKKRTLIHLLAGVGRLPGIGVNRTAGEDAAIRLAIALVKRATMEELETAAGRKCEPFWSKQW